MPLVWLDDFTTLIGLFHSFYFSLFFSFILCLFSLFIIIFESKHLPEVGGPNRSVRVNLEGKVATNKVTDQKETMYVNNNSSLKKFRQKIGDSSGRNVLIKTTTKIDQN